MNAGHNACGQRGPCRAEPIKPIEANRANRGRAPGKPGPSPKPDPGPSPAIKPKASQAKPSPGPSPGTMICHVHHRSISSNYRRQAPVFAIEMCPDVAGLVAWTGENSAESAENACGCEASRRCRHLVAKEMRPRSGAEIRQLSQRSATVAKVATVASARRMRRIRRLHAGWGRNGPSLCSLSATTGPRKALEAPFGPRR